jgi:predicted signal transduction protein with EAL and GGDEF domain
MIIKIDRSFVSPSKASIYNDTLLEAIISLGHKLNMTVLAEGIETQAQLERLRHLRCEAGQGYLFSPTVPAGKVAAMLGQAPGNWDQSLAPSPSPCSERGGYASLKRHCPSGSDEQQISFARYLC